ncbi:MAG: hypothetical protein M1815_002631 [Lichina confinis]|nr:MAG: hypothetical protein M1815_002631 [Lichina confinis]
MFQRLKGAFDSIAEEQARLSATQASSSRSNSTARQSRTSNASPAGRQSRSRRAARADPNGNGSRVPVDPAEFDRQVLEDGDESSSGTGTTSAEKEKVDDAGVDSRPESGDLLAADDTQSKDGPVEARGTSVSFELPTDVRVKLRKLEKLEERFGELLRSYRIAHARVTLIDGFETSLREHTPLTSIADPGALVEYLNQMQLKSDMVMDELKRVTNERGDLKQKLDIAQGDSRNASHEVDKLRDELESVRKGQAAKAENAAGAATPSETAKEPVEGSEELFSYDDELPRVKCELQAKEVEAEKAKRDIQSLQTELAAARESTEGIALNFEAATRELQALKEVRGQDEARYQERRAALDKEAQDLQQKVSLVEGELQDLRVKYTGQEEELRKHDNLAAELETLTKGKKELESTLADHEKRNRTLTSLLDSMRMQLKDSETARDAFRTELETQRQSNQRSETAKTMKDESMMNTGKHGNPGQATPPRLQSSDQAFSGPGAGRKKKQKRKKKMEKAGVDVTSASHDRDGTPTHAKEDDRTEAESTNIGRASSVVSISNVAELQREVDMLQTLLKERDAELERIYKKIKEQEDLQEEIESLKDDLVTVGQDLVESKDLVRQLLSEKEEIQRRYKALESQIAEMEQHASDTTATETALSELKTSFEDLQRTSTSLQTDLAAAQHLAASRYKDIVTLKDALQKTQPELNELRSEVASLRTVRDDLDKKISDVTRLEGKEKDLRSDLLGLKKQVSSTEAEGHKLNAQLKQQRDDRERAQALLEAAQKDLRGSEEAKNRLADSKAASAREVARLQEELTGQKDKSRRLEQHSSKLERELESLREETELKTAQHASAQSLMASMRDQTSELGMQMKEARERCESLEEEVTDAHRLLGERSRESETMRRLLADVEGRADAKLREMRARLESAIEERDRAEDEASTAGRKRAREIEDIKARARSAEKDAKAVEEQRDELARAQKEWKRTRDDLEAQSEKAAEEVKEMRRAMTELRDALDESEQQAREMERQKAELRRDVEERQGRLERLQNAQKASLERCPLEFISALLTLWSTMQSMAEELRGLKAKTRSSGTDPPRSRSSFETNGTARRVASPAGRSSPGGGGANGSSDAGATSIDYVYLKNVLLQFLEQKDKKHQMQLIPVLGMLLHFDG